MSMDPGSTDGREDDDLLVAEYVLGLLSPEDARALKSRIAAEPELAAALASWQSRLSGLDHAFAEVTPPAGGFARLEGRLFPGQASSAGLWESLSFWRGLAASGLAVAVLSLGALAMRTPAVDPDALAIQLVAALNAQEGSGVQFVAVYDGSTGNVRLTALSGDPVPDRDFELWYIEEGSDPVSMGVVPLNVRTEIDMPEADRARIAPGTMLAITLEPLGGSPTGGPTGPIVASGAATPI